jgi:glycosyltransferase involved in cell wall biosynthesis
MNTLITTTRSDKGGIANYYQVMRKHLGGDIFYISRGSSPDGENIFTRLYRMAYDYIKFIHCLFKNEIDKVLINMPGGNKGVIRDIFYIFLSKIFKKKTLLFIHGWNEAYEQEFWHKVGFMRKLFRSCNAYIVLAKTFRESLIQDGITAPIYLLSTMVDDAITSEGPVIRDFDKPITILFLARIIAEKGVFESINAFSKLGKKYPDSHLIIAGTGSELSAARKAVIDNGVRNVHFPGWVKADQKTEVLKKAHLYLLPTYFNEGMPISALEAMAFGLPVITTPVGGIPDFFEEGKMGFLLETRDPEYIAKKITNLIDRPELMERISKYNFNYAKKHFYASEVSKRFIKIINSV